MTTKSTTMAKSVKTPAKKPVGRPRNPEGRRNEAIRFTETEIVTIEAAITKLASRLGAPQSRANAVLVWAREELRR